MTATTTALPAVAIGQLDIADEARVSAADNILIIGGYNTGKTTLAWRLVDQYRAQGVPTDLLTHIAGALWGLDRHGDAPTEVTTGEAQTWMTKLATSVEGEAPAGEAGPRVVILDGLHDMASTPGMLDLVADLLAWGPEAGVHVVVTATPQVGEQVLTDADELAAVKLLLDPFAATELPAGYQLGEDVAELGRFLPPGRRPTGPGAFLMVGNSDVALLGRVAPPPAPAPAPAPVVPAVDVAPQGWLATIGPALPGGDLVQVHAEGNVLIQGVAGSGKTELAKTLAAELRGWPGLGVVEVLDDGRRLLLRSDADEDYAEVAREEIITELVEGAAEAREGKVDLGDDVQAAVAILDGLPLHDDVVRAAVRDIARYGRKYGLYVIVTAPPQPFLLSELKTLCSTTIYLDPTRNPAVERDLLAEVAQEVGMPDQAPAGPGSFLLLNDQRAIGRVDTARPWAPAPGDELE